jgi:hypothetical protein
MALASRRPAEETFRQRRTRSDIWPYFEIAAARHDENNGRTTT